jgi:hypothetical protein
MNQACMVLILVLVCCCNSQAGELLHFAVARQPVPVFNSAQSARPDAVQKKDRCGQVRELEFIALPGTVFRLVAVATASPQVLQVTTDDYLPPVGTSLYVHAELLEQRLLEPAPRKPQLPRQESLLLRLRSAVGIPYIWGGNLREGVGQEKRRQFAGLDCSGLLYEATDGYTPRNTDQLVQFGSAVEIEGMNAKQLTQQLRPLDLIVWKGHVVIVLDQQNAIESILNCGEAKNGVIITPLKKRLEDLLRQRKAVNNWPAGIKKAALFVVRRWL